MTAQRRPLDHLGPSQSSPNLHFIIRFFRMSMRHGFLHLDHFKYDIALFADTSSAVSFRQFLNLSEPRQNEDKIPYTRYLFD